MQQAIQHPAYTYVAILDEMNLARVEHYFSDILSVMESRSWSKEKIKTAPLFPGHKMFRDIYLPSNLLIIGTINMDETTHGFSQKLLDRTNTIELNKIQLDSFDFLDDRDPSQHGIQNVQIQSQYVHLKDAYVEHAELIHEVTNELLTVNEMLIEVDLQIGYRVRDEICFYLIYAVKSGMFTFDQAFDFQVLQKVLPRISGSDGYTFDLLKNLYYYCTNTLLDDEFETAVVNADGMRFPKSARKIMEMMRRFEVYGYTSFWINTVR
jgi:5-methylcytosine-specific restriction endonuclease McrBC GTP-binding regulatory subunit McrB